MDSSKIICVHLCTLREGYRLHLWLKLNISDSLSSPILRNRPIGFLSIGYNLYLEDGTIGIKSTLLIAPDLKARQMQITDSDRVAIRSVIESQLQAFKNDDAVTAFSFATPGIQQTFQNPENFLKMVKNYYQAVYRPRSVLFDDVATVNGALAQPVLLLSPDAVPMRALYLMEQQTDGSWRINGCYLVPIEQPTT